MFEPRQAQEKVIRYRGGWMGVSAVPGSGKTQTLSYLAARLVSENLIGDDQEVLIVTLVNSAVDNFTSRVEGFLHNSGLLPGMGYRVRTLHGLAHDIVRERPDLVGLGDRFQIVDEREAEEILTRATNAWLKGHPDFVEAYINPDLSEYQRNSLQKNWQDCAAEIAGAFIRLSKDMECSPSDVRALLEKLRGFHPLLEMGCEIYSDYQRDLNYRGAVDFDDLIRLALKALQLDSDFLLRLRYRWPYILEDEAQDSSQLQERILRLLADKGGNWVRVGDPNQAIYETFTTANPRFLLNFLEEKDVERCDLPVSGRSTLSIIGLANELIDWVHYDIPDPDLRDALVYPPIDPTLPGDPQPNPPDFPASVYISPTRYSPEGETRAIVSNIGKWLPDHPKETAAVLVPRNDRGLKIVEALKQAGFDVIELLRATQSTRQTAGMMATILRYLAEPASQQRLSGMFTEIHRSDLEDADRKPVIEAAAEWLRKCSRVEDFIAPLPGHDWLDAARDQVIEPIWQEMALFREQVRRWQAATLLPVDQLLLIIAQDLFHTPAELALIHKLALMLERSAQIHPDWHLFQFAQELDTVAQNQRKFLGFTEEDSGFNPDLYPGKVVVATIHKAKGLEWDRVYLASVNNYDFPTGRPEDSFMSERWFVRNHLNLPAETLAKLKALVDGDLEGVYMEEGAATLASRRDYAAERLRLLYVGITRARKSLVITWNTGKKSESVQAEPVVALRARWEKKHVAES